VGATSSLRTSSVEKPMLVVSSVPRLLGATSLVDAEEQKGDQQERCTIQHRVCFRTFNFPSSATRVVGLSIGFEKQHYSIGTS
jgi:hypothetical protein